MTDSDFQKLNAEREALRRFVPSVVRDAIEQNPFRPSLERQTRDLSVLFMDIAGCTRLCETLPPETMQKLIQDYFSSFIDEVHARGGTVNETAGDGLMILFLDGGPEEHARAAAQSALLIHSRTNDFAACQDDECTDLAVHIAINSGMASLGVMEFRGRQTVRATYTASGPVTNIAARLAALAPAGETYLAEETWRRIKNAFVCQALGPSELKNLSRPVEVYSLISS